MLAPVLDFTYFLPSIPAPASGAQAVPADIEITIYPVWYAQATLSWTVPQFIADGDPTFRVFRTRTEGQDYEALHPGTLDVMYFRDTDVLLEQSMYSHVYYKVQALTADGLVYESRDFSPTPTMGDWQRIRKNEINRRELILLRKFTGQDCIVLRRISSGLRCPECWDPLSQTIIRSNCPECFGVGFKHGYRRHFPATLQVDPIVENKQYTYLGKFEQNQVGAWTIAYPDLESLDLIIRLSDNTVYRVEQIQNTSLQGETVRQILRMTQLAKTEVESKIVIREMSNYDE